MSAQQAQDALLRLLEDAFGLLMEGKNAAHLVPQAAAALRALDLGLTGKEGCRNNDEERLTALLTDGDTYFVHLSDGGYSRITLNVFADLDPPRPAIVLDRGLSRAPVVAIWDTIQRKGGAP